MMLRTGKMFGTNKQFTLERLPFSVEGAFLSIFQKLDDGKLYFTICRTEGNILERQGILRIEPVYGGEELPYIYYCDEAKLTIETNKGTIEFTYEQPDLMRVRASCITMRVYCEPLSHEGACEKSWGEVEIAFSFLGKLLFKSLSGGLEHDIKWDFRKVSPYPYYIDITPDNDTGIGEVAIHEYYSGGLSKQSYIPFDEAYERTKSSFERFSENYPDVPIQYRDMAEKAKWIIWHSRLGPRGSLVNTLVYMHKLFMIRAFGWQQGFHAMAMKNNATEAWNLLLAMFAYQNELGGIPDNLSDLNQDKWISTKPPIFGFAVCYVLDNFDVSSLGKDDYGKMYEALSKYTNWWFTEHDHMKTGFASYYHCDESGYDEATLFNQGLPIQAPDLQAYIVMLCEACSRLAKLTGMEEESAHWMSESKRVLAFLTDELWDGEQFLAKLPATGELYKCGSIAQLQPLLLGGRLPKEIIAKIRERLLDESEYLTEIGIASENLRSEKVVMRAFTRGAVVAPTQCFLILGLYDAGEVEAAQIISARYLNALLSKGLALGIHNYRVEPVLGNVMQTEMTPLAVGFPFSSWVGSIFMILASKMSVN